MTGPVETHGGSAPCLAALGSSILVGRPVRTLCGKRGWTIAVLGYVLAGLRMRLFKQRLDTAELRHRRVPGHPGQFPALHPLVQHGRLLWNPARGRSIFGPYQCGLCALVDPHLSQAQEKRVLGRCFYGSHCRRGAWEPLGPGAFRERHRFHKP